MDFTLEPLPFAEDALEPHIGSRTVNIHSQGHIFNCAAQVWNHSFYWKSIAPGRSTEPGGSLREQIERDFGSVAAVKKELQAVLDHLINWEFAEDNFGSQGA